MGDLDAAEARERARHVSEEALGKPVEEIPGEDVASPSAPDPGAGD